MTDLVDKLVITSDCTGIDWHEVSDLIRRAPLGERDAALVQRVFTGSYLCAFATIDGRLVGAARAISDGVTSSAIYDVVIDPNWQGKGEIFISMITTWAWPSGKKIFRHGTPEAPKHYRSLN